MKTIKTELCGLLGIKYPILQGGMAWISNAELGFCGKQRRRAGNRIGHEFLCRVGSH